MMKAYRVFFDRLRNKRYHGGFIDVFANNKTDARDFVLQRLYYDNGKDNFYPFHRTAIRISENEMCKGIVWE